LQRTEKEFKKIKKLINEWDKDSIKLSYANKSYSRMMERCRHKIIQKVISILNTMPYFEIKIIHNKKDTLKPKLEIIKNTW
jgi:hypothetical protein